MGDCDEGRFFFSFFPFAFFSLLQTTSFDSKPVKRRGVFLGCAWVPFSLGLFIFPQWDGHVVIVVSVYLCEGGNLVYIRLSLCDIYLFSGPVSPPFLLLLLVLPFTSVAFAYLPFVCFLIVCLFTFAFFGFTFLSHGAGREGGESPRSREVPVSELDVEFLQGAQELHLS